MDEKQLLKKCLNDLEKKLNWGSSEHWTNSEFSELSKEITEKTGISLSVSSLRRLFGKSTDYKKVYNPQRETKNALTNFLGYKGWSNYKSAHSSKMFSIKQLAANKLLFPTRILGTIFAIVIVFLLSRKIVSKSSLKTTNKAAINYVFEGRNLVSDEIPHTVVIIYDISKLKKPNYISWGDTPLDGTDRPQPQEILNDKGTLTHTYFSKEIFDIRLLDSKKNTIKRIKSFINTSGWECFSKQNEQLLRIDSSNFFTDSGYYANPEFLYSKGIDSTLPFRVFYRNNNNYTISGKDFIFNASFKPSFRKDYIDCDHVQIELLGTLGSFLFTFMNKGCSGEIEAIYLNETKINGTDTDLSDFTIENDQWQHFKLKVKDSIAQISLNQQLILESQFRDDFGQLIGLRFEFKGNGAIRDIEFDKPELH